MLYREGEWGFFSTRGARRGMEVVAVATIMSIAAQSGVRSPNGQRLGWRDDFLYLPEVLYILILFGLIFSGPGRYSLDGLIAW
jgi:uncharacterized membrane protein YphA (DoxX/SURF4 family)